MKTRWRLTRAGAGALLISLVMLAAGVMKTINLLILFGVLLLALVALNAVLAWQSVRRVRPVHSTPCDHFAGQPSARMLGMTGEIANSFAVSIREVSADHCCTAFSAVLAPGKAAHFRVPFLPGKRGVTPVTSSVVSGYPFGFVSVENRQTEMEILRIFPALGVVDADRMRRWLLRAGSGDARRRRPQLRQSPSHADLRSIRPFRSGDSPRLIHWRSTARRNELLIREYDCPEAIDLVLVVESWIPLSPTPRDHERLEETLSLAATLLATWCLGEQTPRVSLVTANTETIMGTASPQLAREFFSRLSEITGSSDFDFQINSRCLASRRSVQLLVSSRPEPGQLPSLLARRSGRVWQRLSPTEKPVWYHPPKQ